MMSAVTDTVEAARRAVAEARQGGLTIGFVPTMGALHEGHASLIRTARAENGFVAVSLFVNPTQFGPNEDLARYPRPREQDLQLCRREEVDLVFAPEPSVMYPRDFRTYVEAHGLQDVLCGASRPGHFRGVATVVLKLFNIIQPDRAYFGQKDAQQVRVIQQFVHDLNVPVEVRVCPTLREADGLALSSRNQYLDPEERRQAPMLYQALTAAAARVAGGEKDAEVVRTVMQTMIEGVSAARLDYAAVVDAESLQPLRRVQGRILLALAVRFGATRLIDNLLVDAPSGD